MFEIVRGGSVVLEELMVEDIVDGDSFFGVHFQKLYQ